MKAATFQVLLEKLGIQSSYSRPRVSNDNPYSEAAFRMLKYRPEYPDNGFKTIDNARKNGRKSLSISITIRGIRNWTPHQSVALNPLKETES